VANTLMSLLVKIGADTSELQDALGKAEGSATKSGSNIVSSLSKIGGAVVIGGFLAAGAAAVGMAGFLMKSVQAASEAEDIQTQLEAVLAQTGKTTGVTVEQINDLAQSLSMVTKFDDEVITSAGGVLARFDKIGKDTMPRAMQATLDLAQSMGIDLSSAAVMVGKVLQTPGEGMLRLKAAGVALTDEQTTLIQSLFDTGRVAEAQDMILKALSGTMGGVAQAAGTTLSGKMAILKTQFGNVMETVGGALLPKLTEFATMLSEKLASPEVQLWITNFAAGIATMASNVITYIPVIIGWFTQIYNWFANNQGVIVAILAVLGVAVAAFAITTIISIGSIIVAAAPLLLVIALIGAVVYILYQAWTNNRGGIQEKTAAVINFIKGFIQAGLAAIQAFWTAHGAQIMAIVTAMWNAIQLVINTVLGIIKNIVAAFQAAFRGDWTAFGEYLRKAWDLAWSLIIKVVSTAWAAIKIIVANLVKSVIDFFTKTDWGEVGKNIVKGIAYGITSAVQWVIAAISGMARAIIAAIKGFLGIKSPSKVFQKFGFLSGQGFAIGLTQATGMIRAAAVRATSTALPAFQMQLAGTNSTGRGSTTNNAYNLTIYSNANTEQVSGDFGRMRAWVRG